MRRRIRPKRAADLPKPDASAGKPNAPWTTDDQGWWVTGDARRCEHLTVRDQFSHFGLTRLSAWWLSLGIEHLRSRRGTPSDNGGHARVHRDMAFELEAVVAGTLDQQQRACDLWQPNFNSSWPREALGMGTPTHFYKPSGTTYAGDKVQVLNFASQAGASAGGHVETPVDGERK